jgi:hypothetical protein
MTVRPHHGASVEIVCDQSDAPDQSNSVGLLGGGNLFDPLST